MKLKPVYAIKVMVTKERVWISSSICCIGFETSLCVFFNETGETFRVSFSASAYCPYQVVLKIYIKLAND